MKFLQALRNVSNKLTAEFEDSNLFNHAGEIGSVREELIANLLRPFLPECYGLGTGQIFSANGEISKQIDVVIYDSIHSNVLFRNRSINLFPCESVYGEIEIKSMLSKCELIKSLDNIASMKRLIREETTNLSISPITTIVLGDGLRSDVKKANPYLGLIFGFDGLAPETLLSNLKSELLIRNKDEMPDIIFCHKKGYMIVKVNGTKITPLGVDFERYEIVNTGIDTIPMMFVVLNSSLNNIRLKAPNYNDYLTELLNEINLRNRESS